MVDCYLCHKSLGAKDNFPEHVDCLIVWRKRLNNNMCLFCGEKMNGNRNCKVCGENNYSGYPGPQ